MLLVLPKKLCFRWLHCMLPYLLLRSNVPDGPILWRGLPYVWTWGNHQCSLLINAFNLCHNPEHHQQFHNRGNQHHQSHTLDDHCSFPQYVSILIIIKNQSHNNYNHQCLNPNFLGDCICRARPGGPPWPSHLRFPQNDKGVRTSVFLFVFLSLFLFVFVFLMHHHILIFVAYILIGLLHIAFCPSLTS